MTLSDWERAAAIYLPLMAALLGRWLNGPQPRQFASCLLSVLWTVPSLLLLQILNLHAGWWTFTDPALYALRGMPLELFAGWILLWCVVPSFALPRLGILPRAVVMIALDCLLMPACAAAVHLRRDWLVGEAVGVALVLLPALCLAEWTAKRTHLGSRAGLQTVTSGMLFLFLIPELIFAARPGSGWAPLLALPGWARQMAAQLLLFLAIPGLGAVLEFAERGGGTPIPYDPPQRLVTSGVYRFCANPMQVSCAVVMLAWAGLLRSEWMALAACVSVIYSAGLATWDEGDDLRQRFGEPWKEYRRAVGNWRWRWKPYHAGSPALVYIARTCRPCSSVRAWLEARHPLGLEITDAETLQAGSLRRMRYDPQDGTDSVDGVRALGRALEHLHLGWALCGTALRLPGVWQTVQLFMDASGLGPREIREASAPGGEPRPFTLRQP